MSDQPQAPRGRAASSNPANRFDRIEVEYDPGPVDRVPTQFLRDASRSIIVRNQSPDVLFGASINPYRGCEHGCIYCYARPTHEYLGFSPGLDFETRILVKENAPQLLRKELENPRYQPELLALSGVTDAYQPIERSLKLTRGCLEVLHEFRNPVGIVTKNALVTRDVDLLAGLAQFDAAAVYLSVTSLDDRLIGEMEPRTSRPQRRLEAIEALADAGVPVGVLVAPVIPGLNDHEIPQIVQACAEAGANFASYILLRLPHGVKDLFAEWLERVVPNKKEKVLNRIRSLRGGKLNDSRFGSRMRGEGPFADQVKAMFTLATRRHGLAQDQRRSLSTRSFRRPGQQFSLFDR